MKKHYNLVRDLNVGRTGFDLSHGKFFDMDLGKIIPVMAEDCIPGDVWDIGQLSTIRAQALVAPIYHRLNAITTTMFIPYRLIFPDWEKFVTGGKDGDDTTILPKIFNAAITAGDVHLYRYNLWDMFGFPMHDVATGVPENESNFTAQLPVNELLWRAYWTVWREYFRDENLDEHFPNTSIEVGETEEEKLTQLQLFMDSYTGATRIAHCDYPAYVCFSKDYFTSALPWQQRGTSPTIPIAGSSSAVWDTASFVNGAPTTPINAQYNDAPVGSDDKLYVNGSVASAKAESMFNDNTITLSTVGVDINDLREAIQVQKWMERNARAGVRYSEYLQSHFNVKPQDYRLNRPEYIGGLKQPIIISEVLQTSETGTTPQGNFTGHGMSVDGSKIGKYHVKEHGVLMSFMYIKPESVYQQGINRQWTKETCLDVYSPEFAHLSEQEITNKEIYFSRNDTIDNNVFGYQGSWDEYRDRRSLVCGKLATNLNYWHLSRIFDSLPVLNSDFVHTEELANNRRDAWAVTDVENGTLGQFIVEVRNILKVARKMPLIAEPGLMDHF